ncbi:MAG: hypothetical protein KME32_28660 [Mojavia pulchra JT2-VF2]|jgi:hypothetical protein|uniref:Uncharacterized protein n=1 Tax=Mojavia pulchra JT2-VF2 TaxID=287848 RepID=A0A951UIQ5_9NOST|nr:hypothetical protein [Mojavia pulchra JT2-VF2]
MAKSQNNFSELTAANLLRSLSCRGGCAPLHTIKFSNVAIQYLLDRKLVKVQNTGCGFLLEIVEEMQ